MNMKTIYLALLALFLSVSMVASAQTTNPNIVLCEITRNLSVGMSGEDVKCLQKYLNQAGFQIAASGPGSPGNETRYFGSLTKGAVAKWQEYYAADVLVPLGLSSGTGLWGSSSFRKYVGIVELALGVR